MSRKLSLIVMFVCLGAFALGLARLFQLRFESGDVYPPYSSLRADPLGTSAFYESLGRTPEMQVSRDMSAEDRLPEGRDTAYLHLAGSSEEWRELSTDTFQEAESFMRLGGRLVVAFFPETSMPYYLSHADAWKTNGVKPDETARTNAAPFKALPGKKKLKPEPGTIFHFNSLKERWGIDFQFAGLPQGDGEAYEPVTVRNRDEPALPRSISWHGGLCFTNLDPAWHVIYTRGRDPVMVERKFGAGSLVLATDSYFVSNEAMLRERHADLLAWLIGPSRKVVFDEAHFGIVKEPGVVMLMRQYRLQGLMAGLLVLAGLFIWKSSTRFAPETAGQEREDFVTGKDSAAGFVNLLRRHIPASDVLNVCVTEWRKSVAGRYSRTRMQRVEIVAGNGTSSARGHPVENYLAICRALKEKPGLQTTPVTAPIASNPIGQDPP